MLKQLLHTILFYLSFAKQLIGKLLTKETVKINHIGNVGVIFFKHENRDCTIYFPYDQKQARKMVNYGITYIKEGKEKRLNLYPGCSLPYTAKECGYDKFVIYNYSTDEIKQEDRVAI